MPVLGAPVAHNPPASSTATRALRQARLPVKLGGLGLPQTVELSPIAFYASWCNTINTVQLMLGPCTLADSTPLADCLRDISDIARMGNIPLFS